MRNGFISWYLLDMWSGVPPHIPPDTDISSRGGFFPAFVVQTCNKATLIFVRKAQGWNTTFGRDFLVVQWLRVHISNAGGLDSIPGQGTRSCMPTKCFHAAMKIWCSKTNKRTSQNTQKFIRLVTFWGGRLGWNRCEGRLTLYFLYKWYLLCANIIINFFPAIF